MPYIQESNIFRQCVLCCALMLCLLGIPAFGAGNGTMALAWDRNPEANVAGYKIYWGEASRQYTSGSDVGNSLQGTLTGLSSGRTYYCAVKAYNTALQESEYSAEITFTYTSEVISVPDPSSRLVLLEAENGSLNAPATVMGSGTNVYVDTNNFSTATQGFTRMSFNLDTAGDYQVWARVKATAASADSFFVTMDSGTEDIFHVYVVPEPTEPRAADWVWKRIHIPGGVPRSYTLATGAHTLKFRTREQGTQLDRVILTNDPAFVPTDALPRTSEAVIVSSGPLSQTKLAGETAILEVAAAATGPVSYQWKRNNIAIPGATSAQLTLSSLTEAHTGIYTVDLARGTAATASAGPALLTVLPTGAIQPVFQVERLIMNSDHSVSFKVTGALLSNIQVYASNDLKNWTLLGTVINAAGTIAISDPASAGRSKRFYKLVTN